MALPTYLSQQLALNQPLVDSAERSKYSEAQDVWAESSEAAGEEIPTSAQLASFGVKSAVAYLVYNTAPHLAEGAHDILTSRKFQRWSMRTENHIKEVGDVFKLRTGKNAIKNVRAALINKATDFTALGVETSDPGKFWYSGLTKLQQQGLGLPIFDNVIKLFTKATYLTDVLSYSVDRGNTPISLDISLRSLGEVSRDRTLDFYSQQFGINRKKLNLIDYLVYQDGQVREGKVDLSGKVVPRGKTLASDVILADKGKYTESVLIGIDPSLGLKERSTGATYAEKVGGDEGYVLIGKGELDPSIRKFFSGVGKRLNFGNVLYGGENSVSEWGPFKFFKNLLGKTAEERSNKLFHAESYTSYALTRTSNLFSEMFNEVGSFFEYLFPDVKKSIYSKLTENNLTPRIQHGHAFAMLGRYSRLATTVGAGLMAINQLGYSMKNGEGINKEIAGALQTTGLAIAGGLIANKLRKRTLPGMLIGGAMGGLGMVGVGPFAAGPIPGVANLIGRANEIRSYIGEATLINDWRRSFEEMMPGSTNPTTALGAGIALGAGFVTLQRFLNKNKVVEVGQREKYLLQQFQDLANLPLREVAGHIRQTSGEVVRVKAEYHERMRNVDNAEHVALQEELDDQIKSIRRQRNEILHQKHSTVRSSAFDLSDLTEHQISGVERDTLSYVKSLEESGQHGVLNNPIGKINDKSNLSVLAEKVTDFTYEEGRQKILRNERSVFKRVIKAVENAPRIKAIAYASGIAALGWFLGTGGLGTVERPRELRELNQGKRLETVRRNQNWEMGQGGYGGDDVLYQRPSLIARLSSGATQAGSSGNHGPVAEFFLKNFTYKLERENYYKRPSPITGAAFDQIPFIYPAIQPIADLIKRPKLMHVGEWKRESKDGKTKYLERTTGLEEIPDQRIGGIAMAAPVSPYQGSRVLGKFWQEATSLGGLVGFYAKSAKGYLTGTSSFGDQRQELESFSRNMDIDSKFYDLHGGGSFLGIPFTSEAIRRFVHRDESKQYNPIRNSMPSWLPDSFKYGNPYTSARHGEGEYRMPGEGYEALHPELKGVNPEDYPLLHKLNILGDVSPYSPQYKGTLHKAKLMRDSDEMTAPERGFLYRHEQMMKEKKNRREFDSYQFKPSSYDNISGTIASVDPQSMSFTLEGYGGKFGVAGITNNVDALISEFNYSQIKAAKMKKKNEEVFSDEIQVGQGVTVSVPASIGQAVDDDGIIKAAVRNNGFNVNKELRSEGNFAEEYSPIANFAMTNYLGKAIGAGWEATTHLANRVAQPIEHIMAFGAAPINKLLPYRDALEDYQSRELYGSEMKGWDSPISDWIAPAVKSAVHNWLGIDFQSPGLRKKRDTEEYFDKLKYAKYSGLSRSATFAGDDRLAKQYQNIAQKTIIGSSGYVSDESLGNVLGGRESVFATGFAREFNPGRQEEIIEALPEYKQKTMRDFYLGKDLDAINRAASAGPMSTFGMDYAADLTNLKEKMGYGEAASPDEAQAMREMEVSQYFAHKSIPRADWIGFNPAVDLEDVKLKYIESEGMNYHDFGIYPSRASYMARKPYIDEQAVQDLNKFKFINPHKAISAVNNANDVYGNYSYNIQGPNRFDSSISIDIRNSISVNPFEQ